MINLVITDQFCRDVLCTALEQGSGYWAESTKHELQTFDDSNMREYKAAVISPNWECKGDFEPKRIDVDSIRTGIKTMIDRGKCHISYKRRLLSAVHEDDAGQIDAECADLILQSSMFDGDVIYG